MNIYWHWLTIQWRPLEINYWHWSHKNNGTEIICFSLACLTCWCSTCVCVCESAFTSTSSSYPAEPAKGSNQFRYSCSSICLLINVFFVSLSLPALHSIDINFNNYNYKIKNVIHVISFPLWNWLSWFAWTSFSFVSYLPLHDAGFIFTKRTKKISWFRHLVIKIWNVWKLCVWWYTSSL